MNSRNLHIAALELAERLLDEDLLCTNVRRPWCSNIDISYRDLRIVLTRISGDFFDSVLLNCDNDKWSVRLVGEDTWFSFMEAGIVPPTDCWIWRIRLSVGQLHLGSRGDFDYHMRFYIWPSRELVYRFDLKSEVIADSNSAWVTALSLWAKW